jgi:type VI secretion system protein ImpM
MAATAPPGWFGKIAAVGDFASRRLAPEWTQACDRWLSDGMQASARQLGPGWLAAYLAAPVWRYAWAPGVVDAQWWFGVLMPSCDNVGRYFPLLVAQPRAHAPVDRYALDHLELWWSHLAAAALHTLAEGATLESFEAALQHAPPWPGAPASVPARPLPAAERERWAVPAGATLGELMHALAADGLKRQLAGSSFWWPLRGGSAAGHCSVTRGLPPASAFADLLAGDW